MIPFLELEIIFFMSNRHRHSNLNETHQILFVGGFMGEFLVNPFIGRYFKSNIEFLRNQYQIDDIETFMPSSLKTIWDNAERLKDVIFNLYLRNRNKKIIIFAHSKGGAEALMSLLRFPEILKSDVIAKVIIFQGCINGTALVDILTNHRETHILSPLKNVQKILSRFTFLECMQQDYYRWYYEQRFSQLDEELRTKFHSIMLIILGTKDSTKEASLFVKITHTLLNKISGENDGILDYESQRLDIFEGIKHIRVNADHGEFVTSWPFSKASTSEKHIFTQMIFDHIF